MGRGRADKKAFEQEVLAAAAQGTIVTAEQRQTLLQLTERSPKKSDFAGRVSYFAYVYI